MTQDYERWSDLADRAALGEPLSEAEQEFLRAFSTTDPLASAEQAVWDAFAKLEPSSDELANRALATAAVGQVTAQRNRTRRTTTWFGGGALAAAAAVVLVVRTQHANDIAATPESVVELVAVGANSESGALAKGSRVALGADIQAMGGPVCVAVEPKIHVCLADGAKIHLSQIGVAERRVDLVAGRVAVALAPLPHDKGERFSIVTNGVWSTAVGTAFSVELLANGAVETIVHEGKVAVGPDHSATVVTAHKIGLSQNGQVSIEPLASHARTETSEWASLGGVAGRSIEAPAVPEAVAATPAAAPSEPAEVVAEPAPKSSAPVVSKKALIGAPAATNEPDTSAPEVLTTARQALREQRWSDAASAYQRIVDGFPSSPEAHTVLVSLGRLEVDRLGRAESAVKHLDAYLARGGTLEVEAELLKIRAYHALGRSADEASAIDAFLSAHPNNLEVGKLREQRAALGKH
jgi:hypothetical protein